ETPLTDLRRGYGRANPPACARLDDRRVLVLDEPLLRQRSDEMVADDAGKEHGREHIHGNIVDGLPWNAGLDLELADVVHDNRADDAGRGPGGQKPPVDRPNETRTEDVGEIGRYGCEAAAIHRENDAKSENEERLVAGAGQRWRGGVQGDPEQKERAVRSFAA